MPEKPIIALMYDFDKTLCTKNMQEYSFIPKVKMDPAAFWKQSDTLAKEKKMDRILAYMYLMIRKSNEADISVRREDFVELGKDLEFYPGVQNWFSRISQLGNDLNITIEHYIISSGLREIIEGSSICRYLKEIFACEFFYDANGAACWPKNVVNYTTKTQFLFRINKRVLDISNDIDLNNFSPEEDRPVPFRNMIYIGDGLTDVPCMKLVKANGGYSIAVYQPETRDDVKDLILHNRVDFLEPADYSEGSGFDITIRNIIYKMALDDRLVRKNRLQIKELSK